MLAVALEEKENVNKVLRENIQAGFKREQDLKAKLIKLEMELKRVKGGE